MGVSEKDIFAFDPKASQAILDRTGARGNIPQTPIPTHLLDEAVKIRANSMWAKDPQWTKDALGQDFIASEAAAFRQDGGLLKSVAVLIAYYLVAVYLNRRSQAPDASQVPPDAALDLDAISDHIEQWLHHYFDGPWAALVRAQQGTDDLWTNFARWLWTDLITTALDLMEAMEGTDTLAALTREGWRQRFSDYLCGDKNPYPLHVRKQQLFDTYARALAKAVVDEALNLPNCSLKDMERIMGLWSPYGVKGSEDGLGPAEDMFPEPTSITLPGQRGDYLEVINMNLYQQLRQAVATADFKKPEGERWPQADLSSESGGLRATAQLRPDPLKEMSLSNVELAGWEERMSQNILAMSDLTADVLDVISLVWLRQARHPEAMATVHADDFLRIRGLKPQKSGTGRRGGYKDARRREIARQVSLLANTWIRVAQMEVIEVVEGKKGSYRQRKTVEGVQGPAIVVSLEGGQITLDERLEPYAWRVRPGDIFAKYLFGPGRETALLSKKLLEYDPHNHSWEKRLGRYFIWQWRIRQAKGTYSAPYYVSTLLKVVREDKDALHPIRTKDRLERALNRLRKDGVIAGWHYIEANEDRVGRKGWWQEWLGWSVVIVPPQQIIDHYAAKIETPQPRALPAPQAAPIDPARIRQVRKDRGLSLIQAAYQIGISPSRLSRIERGENPSSENLLKLRAWLGEG